MPSPLHNLDATNLSAIMLNIELSVYKNGITYILSEYFEPCGDLEPETKTVISPCADRLIRCRFPPYGDILELESFLRMRSANDLVARNSLRLPE